MLDHLDTILDEIDGRAAARERKRPVEERDRERLLGSYGTVRRLLPLLLDTLKLQATDAGAQALDALTSLKRIERKHALEPDDVAMQIVSRSRLRLVKPEPGKINRHAYTFCGLEALRDDLHRRDVFVRRSHRGRWRVRTETGQAAAASGGGALRGR